MRLRSPCWLDELPSTNTHLLERLGRGEDLPDGYLLAVRRQTAGRGRRGRVWVSGGGRDLAFSVVLRGAGSPRHALSAPMAAALAVRSLLHGAYGLTAARVKWPNDVLVGEAKICGLLAEQTGGVLVLGVGLNINMEQAVATRIDRPVTSLFLETGRRWPVESVLAALLPPLEQWFNRWERGGFPALRPMWKSGCAWLGEMVVVGVGDQRRTGRLVDFGEHGQAVLETEQGERVETWAGELRPQG